MVERVETRVRDLTHGRVRGLVVEERDGRISSVVKSLRNTSRN